MRSVITRFREKKGKGRMTENGGRRGEPRESGKKWGNSEEGRREEKRKGRKGESTKEGRKRRS